MVSPLNVCPLPEAWAFESPVQCLSWHKNTRLQQTLLLKSSAEPSHTLWDRCPGLESVQSPKSVWLLLLVGGKEGQLSSALTVLSVFFPLLHGETHSPPASLHGSSPPAPVGPEGNLLPAWHLAAHMDKQTDDWLAKDWVVKPSLFSSHSSSCAVAFLAVISGS